MRLAGTWLVLVALVALGVVAALDGLERDRGEAQPSPAPPAPAAREPTTPLAAPAGARRALRDGGAAGTLVTVDAACVEATIELPALERRELGITLACAPRPRAPGWRAAGETVACRRDLPPPQPGCDTLPPRPLLRRLLGAEGPVSIREVAPLADSRLAAIVRDEGRGLDLLAVFAAGGLVAPPAVASSRLAGLAVSPLRRHVAVLAGSGGVFVLDDAGRLALPGRYRFPLLETRAVAFSPDGAWAALATRSKVYLLETGPSARYAIELPLAAIALDWRRDAEAGGRPAS